MYYSDQQKITLGRDCKTFDIIDEWFTGNDRILIEARSGSGKSILVKNIVAQFPNRYQLYFDYNGELGMNKYPNMLSNDYNHHHYLPSLYEINDFRFPLALHNLKKHWRSLKVLRDDPQSQAPVVLSKVAGWVDVHANDFKKFRQIIEDYPTADVVYGDFKGHPEVKSFHAKYGKWVAPLHRLTKPTLFRALESVEEYFNEEGQKYDIDYALKSYKYISINLGLKDMEAKEINAQIVVGNVLRDLKPVLLNFKPIIVLEEADLLCPKPSKNEGYNLSQEQIIDYALKTARRNKTMMLMIVQHRDTLHPKVLDNLTKEIKFVYKPQDYDRAVFEFKRSESRSGRWFIPLDSSTMYEDYPRVSKSYK